MKFSQEILGKFGSRIGHICMEKGDVMLTTPFWLRYTRCGSIPHLTLDVQEMLPKIQNPLHLTLNTLYNSYKAVKEFEKGIGSFIGCDNQISYLSIHDPAVKLPSGYNTKSTISIWSSTCRVQLDVTKFMDLQEAFCPDWYQALCYSDTDCNSTRKRIVKSVDHSLRYLDECIDRQSKSEQLKRSSIFGSIQGGYDVNERVRSAKETALRPVAGFIIEGFTNYGPEKETVNFEEILRILPEILKELPAEKPRIMHGVWTPDEALKLIELGIDVLDLSYPYICTEEGMALTFNLNFKNVALNEMNKIKTLDKKQLFGINLKDKRHYEDFSSLLKDCECYTCRQFTRSYIHHLMCTSEMLAYVLLMIHNLQHYMKFQDAIHEALKHDKLDDLKIAVNTFNP